MIRYFNYASDNRYKGPVSYLGALQQSFVQDAGSGMIEVRYAAGNAIIFLYNNGKLIKMYHLAGLCSLSLVPGELKALLVGDDLDIRTLSLPMHAVRALSCALDWFPPNTSLKHNFLSLNRYHAELKATGFNGLIHVSLPDLDGLQLWVDGSSSSSEAVYSTSKGFVDCLPDPLLSEETSDNAGNIWVYQPLLEGKSWEIARLSWAVKIFIARMVIGYQKLVGQITVNALNYDLNAAMRTSHWNMRLVGKELIDHHFFPDIDTAQQAYLNLFVHLYHHVVRVVGTNLAQHVLSDAFGELGEVDQNVLNKYSFNPVMISNIRKESLR